MQFPGVPIINDKPSIMQTTDLTIFHVELPLLSSVWLILEILLFPVALHSAFFLQVLVNYLKALL